MVGIIEAAGSDGVHTFDGQSLKAGDRVTWSMVWSCGECFYCGIGLRPKCERLMKFGHDSITANRALTGGMAEYCVLPARTAIFKVPEELSDLVASPANCATATVAAVFREAGSVENQVVVIHGAGMLGITACAMAAYRGACQVIVLEPVRGRRDLALQFGATMAFDSADPAEQIWPRIGRVTADRGADVCLELSGRPESIELGLTLLRPGGRFVLAGATYPSRPAECSGELIVRRILRILGVYNYGPDDLAAALSFLARNNRRYGFASLVPKTFALAAVNEAINYAENAGPPRVAVKP
jgi:alcohol dehydrogenase